MTITHIPTGKSVKGSWRYPTGTQISLRGQLFSDLWILVKPRLCASVIRSWLTSLNGAMRFAREHSTMTAIYCRITGESNGIYPANAPWFTWAISDEQETKRLADVGKHWTCVQMVRPNA